MTRKRNGHTLRQGQSNSTLIRNNEFDCKLGKKMQFSVEQQKVL